LKGTDGTSPSPEFRRVQSPTVNQYGKDAQAKSRHALSRLSPQSETQLAPTERAGRVKQINDTIKDRMKAFAVTGEDKPNRQSA
jgi:hypothetical protein